MADWNFHKDCIHYGSVVKTPKPEPKHPQRMLVECKDCGYRMHYYNDYDFECIRDSCRYFEPKEPTVFDFMEK